MKTAVKYIWIVVALLIFNCSKDDDGGGSVEPAILSSVSPTNGPKTTIVTLNGSNFGTDPSQVQVLFNGKEGSIISVTETQIKATVPPRAYTGPITLNVHGSNLIGAEFTYLITDVKVSTFAGGTSGNADGVGTAAQFGYLDDLVFDKDGNLYTTDAIYNNKIRKITPSGVVTTFAGSTTGYADGTGANARFDRLKGITIDEDGNIYVVDGNNSKIRKITPSGVVSTLAGSTPGFADGIGTAAKFDQPNGIAVDRDGTIYVSDMLNDKIRKITPTGTVSTFAGSTIGSADGNGTAAQFNAPKDIAIDSAGNLFVVEYYSKKLRKISPSGQVTTLAIDPLSNYYNDGLALDGRGNIYLSNYTYRKIFKINSEGIVITLAGSTLGYTDGSGDVAQFNSPNGLTVDTDMNVYVADSNKIRKITQE